MDHLYFNKKKTDYGNITTFSRDPKSTDVMEESVVKRKEIGQIILQYLVCLAVVVSTIF